MKNFDFRLPLLIDTDHTVFVFFREKIYKLNLPKKVNFLYYILIFYNLFSEETF